MLEYPARVSKSQTVYLHWVATPYTWVRSGLFHTIISGDGRLNRLHANSIDLPAHTWRSARGEELAAGRLNRSRTRRQRLGFTQLEQARRHRAWNGVSP